MGRNVLGLELLPERVDFIRRRLRNLRRFRKVMLFDRSNWTYLSSTWL